MALPGLEARLADIVSKIAEIRSELGQHRTRSTAAEPEPGRRKRKPMSAATKRKMAAAQKLRWSRVHGKSTTAAAAPSAPAKNKRKMSAAGRARIIAATKARWAAFHAAQKANA